MRNSGLTKVAGILLLIIGAGCAGKSPELSSGIIYLRQEDYQKAAQILEKAVEVEPDNWEPHFYLANAYAELRRFTEAHQEYEKAKELNPARAQEVDSSQYAYWYDHFMPGVTALKGKEYQEAERLFQEAIQIDPSRTGAYSNLAFAYSKMGQRERSLQVYDTLLQMEPNNADALLSRGQIQRALKRCDQAIESWTKLLEVSPEEKEILLDIADCYRELGDSENALRYYGMALEAMPDDGSIPFGMAVIYYRQDDFALAAEYFLKAAEASGPSSDLYRDALFNRAQMLVRLEDYEAARDTVLELIKVKGDSAEYYDLLGRIYYKLGNSEEGTRMFEKAKMLEEQSQE